MYHCTSINHISNFEFGNVHKRFDLKLHNEYGLSLIYLQYINLFMLILVFILP